MKRSEISITAHHPYMTFDEYMDYQARTGRKNTLINLAGINLKNPRAAS